MSMSSSPVGKELGPATQWCVQRWSSREDLNKSPSQAETPLELTETPPQASGPPKKDFRFMPSVGSWLRPFPESGEVIIAVAVPRAVPAKKELKCVKSPGRSKELQVKRSPASVAAKIPPAASSSSQDVRRTSLRAVHGPQPIASSPTPARSPAAPGSTASPARIVTKTPVKPSSATPKPTTPTSKATGKPSTPPSSKGAATSKGSFKESVAEPAPAAAAVSSSPAPEVVKLDLCAAEVKVPEHAKASTSTGHQVKAPEPAKGPATSLPPAAVSARVPAPEKELMPEKAPAAKEEKKPEAAAEPVKKAAAAAPAPAPAPAPASAKAKQRPAPTAQVSRKPATAPAAHVPALPLKGSHSKVLSTAEKEVEEIAAARRQAKMLAERNAKHMTRINSGRGLEAEKSAEAEAPKEKPTVAAQRPAAAAAKVSPAATEHTPATAPSSTQTKQTPRVPQRLTRSASAGAAREKPAEAVTTKPVRPPSPVMRQSKEVRPQRSPRLAEAATTHTVQAAQATAPAAPAVQPKAKATAKPRANSAPRNEGRLTAPVAAPAPVGPASAGSSASAPAAKKRLAPPPRTRPGVVAPASRTQIQKQPVPAEAAVKVVTMADLKA